MVMIRETDVFRQDAQQQGKLLTPQQREKLLRPYLPEPPRPAWASQTKSKPVRNFLKTQIHVLLFITIHTLFSVYIRLRQAYHAIYSRTLAILYYHHRTPELIQKDVRKLANVPNHLSAILELDVEEKAEAGLEALLDDLAELAAWTACAGIQKLTVYERTGLLKQYIPATHRAVSAKLHAYFGQDRPSLQVKAPHTASYLNGEGVIPEDAEPRTDLGHLSILLISEEDGRSTLVDLTKTLTEMSQREKLSTDDISLDLIDVEISESVMDEPDLLVLFGPDVELKGYPPWQLRLTEIFHAPDNHAVEYQVFLRALHRFAKVQMRFGR
ncbi:hypothetical protein MMC25_006539 [Agyrium rufum]|nr:hypothetical protein [Agyrium rufum]